MSTLGHQSLSSSLTFIVVYDITTCLRVNMGLALSGASLFRDWVPVSCQPTDNVIALSRLMCASLHKISVYVERPSHFHRVTVIVLRTD